MRSTSLADLPMIKITELICSNSVTPGAGAIIQSQNSSIGNDTNVSILFGSYVGNFVPGKGLQGGSQTANFDLLSAPDGQLQISDSELPI